MLVLFRRNDIIGFAILIFVALVLRLPYFITPPELAELGSFYTTTFGHFVWLRDFYSFSPSLYIFLSTVFWIAVSIYFKQVLVNQHLVQHRDFVASIALILAVSALPPFMILSVTAMAACSLFVALSLIMGTQYNKPARARYFGIGCFIGLSIVLYWPSVFVFFAALFMLLSIRIFVWQEILAMVLGALMPVYLVLSLYFIFSGQWYHTGLLAIALELPVALNYKLASVVLAALFVVMTFYGLYVSRNNNTSGNKILLIKKWNGILFFLLAGLLTALCTPLFPSHSFVFALLPFSIILSSALTNNHKKYNTFTFYLVLIAVLALQWIIRFV